MIRCDSAWASRARSPRTNRRSSGRATSSLCPPAVSLSWLATTAAWITLSIETGSRTSEIWPCAARVTSISSSTRRPSRADLALEDLAQADQDRVAVLEGAQHARRVGDRRQRVAQLVRQHREELALAALGEAQLLRALGQRFLEFLALVHVDAAADVAGRRAAAAEARHAVVEHPAVLAVVAPQPEVQRERRARLEAGRADAVAAVDVFGVDDAPPAVAQQLSLPRGR